MKRAQAPAPSFNHKPLANSPMRRRSPTLRGLFGISVDAATKTITVNPHLPAGWGYARVSHLQVGDQAVGLDFHRDGGVLRVESWKVGAPIHLRSDVPDAKLSTNNHGQTVITIPLLPVEIGLPVHMLPVPGSRPEQVKILSTETDPHSITVKAQGVAGSSVLLSLASNQRSRPHVTLAHQQDAPDARVEIEPRDTGPLGLNVHFPKGQGWQTLEFTLTW